VRRPRWLTCPGMSLPIELDDIFGMCKWFQGKEISEVRLYYMFLVR